ncbi:hypothetical protein CASFOL_008129 [Castilleja foliolosa]|uniref:Uncharacterized protein n=1 Tax=Castilleja foliolosa TaxID=1961234 RepID=A0ABD3DZC9_9LAMI
MDRKENGLIGDNSHPNHFSDDGEGSVLSSNFFMDHVGEVVLTYTAYGLSWKLVDSLRNRFLKGQDLAGVLPPSLAKLPHIKTIDLTRNYPSGTIHPEWASTKLEYLSLETNMFTGSVPAELGKLTNLVNLILSTNNLTNKLPIELKNLKKLNELLSSNTFTFTGKVPSFGSWTNLTMLELQASGFEGPIPSSISLLKNLTELVQNNMFELADRFLQNR